MSVKAAPGRKRGRQSHLNFQQRLEVLQVYREHPDWSYGAIARKVGYSDETVRLIIKAYLLADQELVKYTLATQTPEMLENWRRAAETGARYGKHAPARDWLQHAGAIEVIDQSPKLQIAVVNVSVPGLQEFPQHAQAKTRLLLPESENSSSVNLNDPQAIPAPTRVLPAGYEEDDD